MICSIYIDNYRAIERHRDYFIFVQTMNTDRVKADIANSKIEFEENQTVMFIQKFWQFSKFYGKYLGSMHSNSFKQQKLKTKKIDSLKN